MDLGATNAVKSLGSIELAFPERNYNPPVEGINGKFQGVEQKPLEFQGYTKN